MTHPTFADLDAACAAGLLQPAQVQPLLAFLQARALPAAAAIGPAAAPATPPAEPLEAPRFRLTHVLYYLGGLIAIGAMTLFMTLGWERFGGAGLLAIALAYFAGLWAVTGWLLHDRRLPVPAGITATLAVVLTPMAVYGLQQWLGLWPDDDTPLREYHRVIDWRWLLMELATLAVAAVALWRWRLPFLVLPVAVTLWYMGMDVVPALVLKAPHAAAGPRPAGPEAAAAAQALWEARWALSLRISLVFGLGMVALALWADLRRHRGADYGFWLHLFGVASAWGALTAMDATSEWGRLGYAAINVAMILFGAVVGRRVWAVFGALGVAAYLGHLAWRVFPDSLLLPFALSLIGLGVIALGIVWQRHEAAWTARLRAWLPPAWQARLAQAP
jgi:hypothetical protein